MRQALLNFVSSDAGTCSGRPAEPVGKLVRWERVDRGGGVRGPRVATVVRLAQEAAGLQSERNGMWRVKEVKDVRRREGTEAAWDVLVGWAGRHEDSWVARATLSRPLQKEVRSMLACGGQKRGERRGRSRLRQAGERR